MTQTSRPWDGTNAGDRGPYSDQQWRKVFGAFVNGVYADEGILRKYSADGLLGLEVSAGAGLSIDVNAGYAVVQGFYYENDATVNLSLTPNQTTNARIDLIVLRADWTTQTVRLARKTGTASTSPSAPVLTQTNLVTWEIPLAQVAIAAGATSVAAGNIVDARRFLANDAKKQRTEIIGTTPGGTPQTVTVEHGDIAAAISRLYNPAIFNNIDVGGNDRWVVNIIGVIQTPGDNPVTPVLTHGLARVNLDSAVSAGDMLGVQASGYNSENSGYYPFGLALEDGTPDTPVLAHVNVDGSASARPMILMSQELAQNTNGPALTAATWVKRVLNTATLNRIGGATLDTVNNEVDLPVGTYLAEWWAVGNAVDNHQTRLRDVTNAATLLQGMTAYASNASGHMTLSRGKGVFAVTTVNGISIQLQHWANTTNATGQGRAANLSAEIYARLKITWLGKN